jgi:hypothetical protein
MPLRRRFSGLFAVLAALGCLAALAPAAGAAPALPAVPAGALATVDSTVSAAPPLREVTREVAAQVRPAAGTVTPSGSHGSGHPVSQTIAPIAEAATASAPPPAVAAASLPGSLREHARDRVSGIAASVPAEHVSSERLAHGHGMNTVARYPSRERGAPAHDAGTPTDAAVAPARGELARGLAPASDIGADAGEAAAGASSGFFFGGGFGLLVALLLLAGPGLRRCLALPPAVCRPAAFLLVLERPG